MGKNTTISWTDHTFNPWWGCTPVSPGCDHCYAMTMDHGKGIALDGRTHWGKGVPRLTLSEDNWAKPLAWDRAAARAGVRRKVFCASMADVMDSEAPPGALERLCDLINQTPHLIWQLLTKRPQHYLRYLPLAFKHNNVWLGASAENQHFYDIRLPHLYATAKYYGCIAFISYEPALGPLTISEVPNRPDWVICGGETGHGHRPMERKWADDIKAECERYGVQFWMKQMSALTPAQGAAFIPVELLIRQFPSTNGSHNYPAADHQEHRADGPEAALGES